jgi:hypothetical protein
MPYMLSLSLRDIHPQNPSTYFLLLLWDEYCFKYIMDTPTSYHRAAIEILSEAYAIPAIEQSPGWDFNCT